jgi:vesicle coat complex subunit
MKNKIFKIAGTAVLVLAAQFSFAQVNLGAKSSTNAAVKVNTGVVNKTAAATRSTVTTTAHKAHEVKAKTANTVRESARVNGSINANANANANAQRNANENSVLNGTVISETTIDADGKPVMDKTKEAKEKTKKNAEKTKTKIKDKSDDTKTKVKETKPSVDGSVEGEVKVKAKKND